MVGGSYRRGEAIAFYRRISTPSEFDSHPCHHGKVSQLVMRLKFSTALWVQVPPFPLWAGYPALSFFRAFLRNRARALGDFLRKILKMLGLDKCTKLMYNKLVRKKERNEVQEKW